MWNIICTKTIIYVYIYSYLYPDIHTHTDTNYYLYPPPCRGITNVQHFSRSIAVLKANSCVS
jgi:hypothetical protein